LRFFRADHATKCEHERRKFRLVKMALRRLLTDKALQSGEKENYLTTFIDPNFMRTNTSKEWASSLP